MNIFEILDSNEFRERLSAVMLEPRKIERFLALAKTDLRNNPRVASCEIKSLCGAIVQAGQFGLEIGGIQGHAYLTPKKTKDKITQQYIDSCQLIIGYKGMISLGVRSGKLLSLEVQKVCKNDYFKRRHGDNKGLEHEPNDKEERGDIIGYYAYAHLVNHDKAFEYMSMKEIDELKKEAGVLLTDPRSPWVKFPEAMCKKTVIRQLFKFQSLSPELDKAIGLDEMADAGVQSEALSKIGADFVKNDENMTEATSKIPEVLPEGWHRVNEIKEEGEQQDLL